MSNSFTLAGFKRFPLNLKNVSIIFDLVVADILSASNILFSVFLVSIRESISLR